MKNREKIIQEKKSRRKARVRAKVRGSKNKPRLSVYRSHKHIYAQLIDDEKKVTLLAVSDQNLTDKKEIGPKDTPLNKKEKIAYAVGKMLAQKAGQKKLRKAVFDRGHYKYHGRVKALASGAREGGLVF